MADVGFANDIDSGWSNDTQLVCDDTAGIYCFEQ